MRRILSISKETYACGEMTVVRLLMLDGEGCAVYAGANIDSKGEVCAVIITPSAPLTFCPDVNGTEIPADEAERLLRCLRDLQDAIQNQASLTKLFNGLCEPYTGGTPLHQLS